MQRHIPSRPREACPRLSKLGAGRAIIFQGFALCKTLLSPTIRPRPRIMNSLHLRHPLIPSFTCKHAKPSWASSPELGKASEACMPFVPVSMEATTLPLLLCPTLFLSCLSLPSFYVSCCFRLCTYPLVAASTAHALRVYYTIHHFLATPQLSTSLPQPRITCHPRRAQLTSGDLPLRAKVLAASNCHGVQRPRLRTRSSRHSCHRRRRDPRRCRSAQHWERLGRGTECQTSGAGPV